MLAQCVSCVCEWLWWYVMVEEIDRRVKLEHEASEKTSDERRMVPSRLYVE